MRIVAFLIDLVRFRRQDFIEKIRRPQYLCSNVQNDLLSAKEKRYKMPMYKFRMNGDMIAVSVPIRLEWSFKRACGSRVLYLRSIIRMLLKQTLTPREIASKFGLSSQKDAFPHSVRGKYSLYPPGNPAKKARSKLDYEKYRERWDLFGMPIT